MGILGKLKTHKEDEKAESKTTKKPAAKKTEKKEETAVETTTNTKKVKGSVVAYKVLRHPLVTEKSAVMGSLNKYSFIVDSRVNKINIKQAIKELYGVTPTDVRTINVAGKEKKHGRSTGRRSDYKKAIVTLPKGKTITIHEGV